MKHKHKQFVLKYIELNGNASQSYKEVYGDIKDMTARCNAAKLLKRPDVKEAIAEHQRQIEQRGITSIEEVLTGIMTIARDVQTSKSVRLKAYGLAGQTLGMFKTEIKHSGQIDSTLTHLSDEELEARVKEDELI